MKEKSIVKTFRLPISLSEKIDLLRTIKDVKMQDIIKNAIVEYLNKHFDNSQAVIDKIGKQYDMQEYLYIPLNYYMLYNNLSKIEVQKQVANNEIKTISLGGADLVMIKISENIYKKAELVLLRANMSNMMQEVNLIKNEINAMKRKIKPLLSSKA